MNQAELLDGLLGDVRRRPGSVVVLDLDDTIFSTVNRHLRILREFAERVQSQDLRAAELLRGIEREQVRYLVTDTAAAAGLSAELAKDLKGFWFARFFKNPYLLEDDVVPGAPEYAAELVAAGAALVYMTGRDEGMREGTEASLSRHGFPLPDDRATRLFLKPRFDAPDFEYKSEALHRIAELGPFAASFENEPAHVNLIADRFPEGRHFLLETRHSGKPVTPHPRTLRIRDFRRA